MLEPLKSKIVPGLKENIDAIELVVGYPAVPLTVDCVIFGFDENSKGVCIAQSQ